MDLLQFNIHGNQLSITSSGLQNIYIYTYIHMHNIPSFPLLQTREEQGKKKKERVNRASIEIKIPGKGSEPEQNRTESMRGTFILSSVFCVCYYYY